MTDTIAAVSTPPGRGGIGVVRVSGPRAGEVARAVAGRLPEPRVATSARFLADDGETLDNGLVLWFPAPHSYTGEDTLELQGHGGPVVLDRVVGRVLSLGARPARPGEFTERAFLNGKLDLVQAEAVADLIDAATHEAARLARRSLDGALSERVNAAVDELVAIRTLIEGALDFPDEEIPAPPEGLLAERLDRVLRAVAAARGAAARGNLLREGFAVVIVGRPNVGKSSLLNRLAGRERAIVTEVPGTTRDTVQAPVQVDGLPLRIVDTAGLRPTDDPVERIGIERTWAAVAEADAVLAVVDDRCGLEEADREILDRLPDRLPRVIVHNKIDLTGAPAGEWEFGLEAGSEAGLESESVPPCPAPATSGLESEAEAEAYWASGLGPGLESGLALESGPDHRIRLSAKTGEGVDRLRERLKKLAGFEPRAEGLFMARRRHLVALDDALAALEAAKRNGAQGAGSEIVAEDLRLAQRALGKITGEFTTEDLLGRIFATFCIGK